MENESQNPELTPQEPTLLNTTASDDDDDALFQELERDDGDDIAAIREQRMMQIKKEMEKLEQMRQAKHGTYTEMNNEKELMDLTIKVKYVVIHFFHKDFRRCAIMDKHLQELAQKHFETKFVKIDVENSPFLVEKLKVQILPCVLAFVDGINVDRMVGFEELGNTDDFTTAVLELRLSSYGVIKKHETKFEQIGKKSIFKSYADEEDDFDD